MVSGSTHPIHQGQSRTRIPWWIHAGSWLCIGIGTRSFPSGIGRSVTVFNILLSIFNGWRCDHIPRSGCFGSRLGLTWLVAIGLPSICGGSQAIYSGPYTQSAGTLYVTLTLVKDLSREQPHPRPREKYLQFLAATTLACIVNLPPRSGGTGDCHFHGS